MSIFCHAHSLDTLPEDSDNFLARNLYINSTYLNLFHITVF